MHSELNGRHITVMGLGRFGGGVGVARWLVGQGADVLVTDLDPPEKLGDPLAAIDDLVRAGSVCLRLGEHNVSDFTDTDVVVANPAVPTPWENRFLRAASAAGIAITTEIRLVVERLPSRERVIGVTGTVGKSTTSAMIAHGLAALGDRVHFGGNIGGSLLPSLGLIGPTDRVVLELSSAMLYWLGAGVGYAAAPGWSPAVAVVTNIAPNHVDWHGSFEHYRQSKRQILRDQRAGDRAIIHQSLAPWAVGAGVVRTVSEEDSASLPPLAIPGRHNRLNAAMALAAIEAAGADVVRATRALTTFPGLPDRLQLVGVFRAARDDGNVRAYNDSKSTTPESCALALQAMNDDPAIGVGRVRLICGGYDKKIDLTPMARAAAECARAYTIGATGDDLARSISLAGGRVTACGTLDRAVALCCDEVLGGEAILLSPGCASWDQFTNYEERGRRFTALVRERMRLD